MKIKSVLFACCLGLLGTAVAGNRHIHPKADVAPASVSAEQSGKSAMAPGYCEIELINDSRDHVTVYGQFDDGSTMSPFNMYTWEAPHYISLYFYGYCHRDMYLDIVTFSGYHIYSGYTRPGSTVRIVPYLTNQVKAQISTR
ncbi:hypothetical protein [Legionella sp. CNM-4043-24]|uniref:hypothetical protein n=1 Tax=Legionella sp. CNM-4043-24 TaxID=3421646 RepID=UPI00403A8F73